MKNVCIARIDPHTGLIRCKLTNVELFFPLSPAVWGTLECWSIEGRYSTVTLEYFHEARKPKTLSEIAAVERVLTLYSLDYDCALDVRDQLPPGWQSKRRQA